MIRSTDEWSDLYSFLNREKAEQTIWNRLQQLTAMKKKRLKSRTPMKIGILGKSLSLKYTPLTVCFEA